MASPKPSTMVTMNWMSGTRPMGSCGLPVPGLATRIVDPATLEDLPIGAEGELIVRGPNLMQGYHNKPAETAAALRKGWYHTGDLAKSDPNGYLTITGRIKELIIGVARTSRPPKSRKSRFSSRVIDCAVVGVRMRRLAKCHSCLSSPKEGSSTWNRCSCTAVENYRPTKFRGHAYRD